MNVKAILCSVVHILQASKIAEYATENGAYYSKELIAAHSHVICSHAVGKATRKRWSSFSALASNSFNSVRVGK